MDEDTERSAMEITKTQEGSTLTLTLVGNLDAVSAPQLESEITASLDEIDHLVIDFEDVEYISSAGLRTIMFAQKAMEERGSMELLNVDDDLMEIFELTGFDALLTFV